MADLKTDDRGQLLLVGAFILAAAFVVLALVVNSAIFTENLATRDDVPGSQDALEYRDEVRRGVGDIIRDTNHNNSRTASDAQGSIEQLGAVAGIDQAVRNRVVSVSHVSTQPGIKIAQDQPRELTNNASSDDWTLATDVNRTRNVRLNVTDFNSGTVEFVVNGTSDEWVMSISETGAGTDAEVTVSTPGGTTSSCVRENTDTIFVDVTAGTVDGEPCPALSRLSDGTEMQFGAGVDPGYNISIRNGDAVEGMYSMILEDVGGAGAFDPLGGNNYGSAPDEPYYLTGSGVVYSITVHYEFYTPQVGFETDVRAAPGEVAG